MVNSAVEAVVQAPKSGQRADAEDLSSLCCPNPACPKFEHFGGDNLRVAERMGKDKCLRRLACRVCQTRFSELRGSLLEYTQISEGKVVQIVKCLTYGNSVEATADKSGGGLQNCATDRYRVADGAPNSFTTRTSVNWKPNRSRWTRSMLKKGVKRGGKRRTKAAWIFTAVAVCSRLLLDISVGNRDAQHADSFVARVAARLKSLPLFSVDNWKAYYGAFLRIAHRVVQRRRRSRSQRGRRPLPVLAPRADLKVAVVNKVRNAAGRVVKVTRFALYGKLKEIKRIIKNSGQRVINTSFIERLHATLRSQTARLFRRTRARTVLVEMPRNPLHLWRDVYNWVRVHRGLQGRTPAMAAGLTDHVWSLREYVRVPIHPDPLYEAELQATVNALLNCPLDPRKRAAA